MDRNKLYKICRIKEVSFGLQHRGFTKEHIYSNFIYPVYFISRRTYDEYMRIDAERNLQTQYGQTWSEIRDQFVPLSYEDMIRQLSRRGMGDSLFASPVNPATMDFHVGKGCKH